MTQVWTPEPRLEAIPLSPLPYTTPTTSPTPAGEVPVHELEICPLHTARELSQVLHLRSEIHLPEAALADPHFQECEARRDRAGFVAAFRWHGEVIGTIRLIPLGLGLAPCEKLLVSHQGDTPLMPGSWEVGRLVLAPQYRAGPDHLKRCLFLTLQHLVDTADISHLFASCTPVLGRLYRRFGFTTLVKDACAGADGSYSLIHGDVPTVFEALAGSELERQAVAQRLLTLRTH